MLVDSLMHRPVVARDAAVTARDAALAMQADRVGCLVVTRENATVGIVTERDLVFRVLAARRDPDATTLGQIMSAPVATITPSDSIEAAAEKMRTLRVKRLVVVNEGRAVGVISVTDIAYASPEQTRGMMDAWLKQRWEG